MPVLEDRCLDCGEIVVNAEPGDPHFEKQDGTPCGGKLEPYGEWYQNATEIPSRKAINWAGLTHC